MCGGFGGGPPPGRGATLPAALPLPAPVPEGWAEGHWGGVGACPGGCKREEEREEREKKKQKEEAKEEVKEKGRVKAKGRAEGRKEGEEGGRGGRGKEGEKGGKQSPLRALALCPAHSRSPVIPPCLVSSGTGWRLAPLPVDGGGTQAVPFPGRSLLERRVPVETSGRSQADLQLLWGRHCTPGAQGHPAAC